MLKFVSLLRPIQWVKNVFIFLPIFFDGKMFQQDYIQPSIVMFFAYCLAASGIYCYNDIYDVEADKLHPKKCKRPIASGVISIPMGYVLMGTCIISSLLILWFYPWQVGLGRYYSVSIILFYVLMNIFYCVKLKQLAIIDIFTIAVGFVLRVFAGGLVTGIYLSHWIVLMTFLLALFLAFAKRRDDVVIYEKTGVKTRKNVNRYSLDFMNQAIVMVGSITMVCYIMYTVSHEVIARFQNHYVYLTVVFVLAGIIRYMQITIVDVKSGSPTKVLMNDRFVQLCLIGWTFAFAVIIYV